MVEAVLDDGQSLLALNEVFIGHQSHQSARYRIAWGDRGEALFSAADYILWAPAMEELAFRGLLYYSLRHRLGPLTAAIVTAGFFAGLHFYALPGFLMTLWSGLVWALAFERLRSLLPGIGAHAVYNGLFVAGLVLLYR